jgi:hypothetical protein
MKKLTLSIIGVLITTVVFSQTILTIVNKNDTLMCFNKNQLKSIVTDLESSKYNDMMISEYTSQIEIFKTNLNTCKLLIENDSVQITKYVKLVDVYKKDSVVKTEEIRLLKLNQADQKTIINNTNVLLSEAESKRKFWKTIAYTTGTYSVVSTIILIAILAF